MIEPSVVTSMFPDCLSISFASVISPVFEIIVSPPLDIKSPIIDNEPPFTDRAIPELDSICSTINPDTSSI